MAGAGGQEVGRVSIRVVPNTDGFRQKTKKGVEKETAGIEAEINVGADTSEIRRDVTRATQNLPDAEVDVKVNTNQIASNVALMRKKLGEINLSFERGMRGAMDIQQLQPINFQDVQRKLNKLDLGWDKKVKKFLEETQTIKLEVDPKFDERLKQRLEKSLYDANKAVAKTDLSALVKRTNAKFDLQVELDKVQAEFELAALRARESADALEIALRPEINNGALAAAKAKLKAAFRREKVEVDVDVNRGALSRLSESLSKIKGPGFGSGINPTGYAVIFAGITAVAAPLFGLLTTALLTLPGLIAAIATPISAVLLGLEGFKTAAAGLVEPFERLKETMTNVAAETFTPVFDKLAGIFPAIERSLPLVTRGLADMAQSAVDVVTSSGGMARIEATIANIGAALSNAAPGIAAFTDGFLSLAESFTGGALSGMTDWFNQAGESFSNWIDDLTRKDWFTGVSKLDTAFQGLGGTLKTILEAFGSMAAEGMKFFENPQNIEDFNQGLKDIGESLRSIVALSNTLNNQGDLFKGATPKVDETAFSDDLFKPFTSEDAPWRDMVENFKIAWSSGIAALQMQFSGLWSTITMNAQMAAMQIGTAFSSVSSYAASALNGVVGVVASVMSQVIAQFSQVPAAFSSAWSGIAAAASSIWGQVVSAVASAISQVVAAVVSGGAQVVGEVSSWPGKISAALAGLAATGAAAGQALVQGLINGIAGMIGSAIAKAQELAASVGNAVKGALGINSPSKVMHGYGENAGQGFVNGLGAQQDKIVSLATQLMQAIKDVFGSAEGLTLNFNLGGAQTAMQGLATSAQDFSSAMVASAPAVTSAVGKIDSGTRQQLDLLQIEKDKLELERQQLQAQKNMTGDKGQKAAIQQRIDELNIMKQQLTMQHEQLEYQAKYSGEVANTTDQYSDQMKQMAGIPMDFAKNVGGQFMNDLGIGGNGAISQAVQQGLQFGEQFIFNVGSMDEALTGKQNITNKKSLQFTQR